MSLHRTTEKFVILGAGGAGRMMYWHLQRLNLIRQDMGLQPCECIGFLNDIPNALDGFDNLPPILGPITEEAVPDEVSLVLAIGYPHKKQRVINRMRNLIHRFPNIDMEMKNRNIGDVTNADRRIQMGYGNYISGGVFFTAYVKFGNFNYLHENNIRIGHDTVIGNNCEINSNVFIGGNAVIGDGVYLAPGSVVSAGHSVGSWSQVSANSTVMKNVPSCSFVVGVPGKIHCNFFDVPTDI